MCSINTIFFVLTKRVMGSKNMEFLLLFRGRKNYFKPKHSKNSIYEINSELAGGIFKVLKTADRQFELGES